MWTVDAQLRIMRIELFLIFLLHLKEVEPS